MEKNMAFYRYLLGLGDTALIHGHRLSEWCGKGPTLEEDLALSNMALDYIGRANALLKYAAEVEGKSRTEDDLAFKRGEREFYNLLITELPKGDFANTMAKQLLLSSFEYFLFSGLSQSKDEKLAGIATKAIKEVRYHWTHARDWCLRLGKGTIESHDRLQAAINDLWSYTAEFFEESEHEKILEESRVAVQASEYESIWKELVYSVIKESDIDLPFDGYMQTGGNKGVHTEHLGYILAEMQYLPRAYPDAIW